LVSISAKTVPIALILGGVVIIVYAISAKGFGNLSDSYMNALVILGTVFVLLGFGSWIVERKDSNFWKRFGR
jgi:hypothetical protein